MSMHLRGTYINVMTLNIIGNAVEVLGHCHLMI
jgi:hypothetical protein